MLDPIPDEIKDFKKKTEKFIISKIISFKKIAIMQGKGESFKIKGSVCNIPVEAANTCNILPRPAVSSELILVRLKRDLKYRIHIYFEPVCSHILYQALAYLKSHNNVYTDISITKGHSSEELFRFSDIVEIEGEHESATEKIISDGTEMSERKA